MSNSDLPQNQVLQPASLELEEIPIDSKKTSVTEPTNSPEEPLSVDFDPGWRFYCALLSLCTVIIVVALDATSLSVALPIISEDLGGTAIEAFWCGTSFLIASTVFQPNFASLSHIFGRRPLLFVAIFFFSIGSIVAAIAKNFAVLIVGRTLQGVGGGGVIALNEILITDLIPLRLRGKYLGILNSIWAVGTVIGPLVGGGLAQKASWVWIFWINLPLCGLACVVVAIFLRLNFVQQSLMKKLRRIDWLGSALLIASLTSFMIPLTWGGIMYSWTSWRTLLPLIIGAVGLGMFVLYERFIAEEPVIRLSVFGTRTGIVTYFGAFVHGVLLWSILYYEPLYYQAIKNLSPTMSGVATFPQTFTVVPGSIVCGLIVTKTGAYRWSLWLGWVITTLGVGILYLLDVQTSTVQWIFINIVNGIGLGTLFTGLSYAIQASSKQADIAFAVALFSFFRNFGQAVGVAVGGVVFQNELKKRLLTYPLLAPLAEEYSQNAAGLVHIIQEMSNDLPQKAMLLHAYADGLKLVWAVMCGISGAALIASLFTEHYSVDVVLETEQGLRANMNETALDKE